MAVDPGPALAKAGTGLTVGENAAIVEKSIFQKELYVQNAGEKVN